MFFGVLGGHFVCVEAGEGPLPLFAQLGCARIFERGTETQASLPDFVSVTVGAVGVEEGDDLLVKGLSGRSLPRCMNRLGRLG
jgi:hypothetical protein